MLKALGLQLKVGVGVVALETASVCVGRAEKDDIVGTLCVALESLDRGIRLQRKE